MKVKCYDLKWYLTSLVTNRYWIFSKLIPIMPGLIDTKSIKHNATIPGKIFSMPYQLLHKYLELYFQIIYYYYFINGSCVL